MSSDEMREELAATLCDDFGARVIAGQVDAPMFADSAPHVRDYWIALAKAIEQSRTPASEVGEGLSLELMSKARGALAFAASRSALTAEEERAILAALATPHASAPVGDEVERVARALYSRVADEDWNDPRIEQLTRDEWSKLARAAIAALSNPNSAADTEAHATEMKRAIISHVLRDGEPVLRSAFLAENGEEYAAEFDAMIRDVLLVAAFPERTHNDSGRQYWRLQLVARNPEEGN